MADRSRARPSAHARASAFALLKIVCVGPPCVDRISESKLLLFAMSVRGRTATSQTILQFSCLGSELPMIALDHVLIATENLS